MNSNFDQAQKLRNNGQIDEAVLLYQKAREIALEDNDTKLAVECLHMIGVAYYQIEKFADAKNYLLQSQEEFENQKDTESVGFVLRDLGAVAKSEKDLEQAKKLFSDSIEKLHTTGNIGHEGMSLVKLGRVYAEEGDFTKALDEINKGIALLEKSTEKFFLSSAYLDRAKVDIQHSLSLLDSISNKDEFTKRREEIKKLLGIS